MPAKEVTLEIDIRLGHVAQRIFERPLTINRTRLHEILNVLTPRFLGDRPLKAQERDRPMRRVLTTEEGIAIIPVHGLLVHRSYNADPMSGITSYESVGAQVEAAAADEDVRGIILDIDSGGGEANGVFDLSDQIHTAREAKPVWAVANEAAYSGAYAIASAADRVILPRTGGVGSVGVVAVHLDASEAEKAEGLSFTEVFAGGRKTELSQHRALSDDARGRLQAEVNRVYEIFVATVSRNRAITPAQVKATEAGLYHGDDALASGLADEVGTMAETVAKMDAFLTEGAETMKESKDKGAGPDKPAAPERVETPTPAAQGGEVVDLDSHRDAASKEARAYAATVTEICTAAGLPEMAPGFITGHVAIMDVRKKVLEEKAARSERGEISNAAGDVAGAEALAAANYGWDEHFKKYHAEEDGARTLADPTPF